MNATQKAIAATFYRLLKDKKMCLKDVPNIYKKDLAAYKKSQKGLIDNEKHLNRGEQQERQEISESL